MTTTLRIVGAPRFADVGVWMAAALLLGSSAAFGRVAGPGSRSLDALGGDVHMNVPAGYSTTEDADGVSVQRPALGSVAPSLAVRRIALPAGTDPALFRDLELTRIERARADSGVGYRTLEAGDTAAFGAEHSSFSRYAVLRDPPLSVAGDAVMPIVVVGMDALVMNGGAAYHVSTEVDASDEAGAAQLAVMLQSLRFDH